ncbi:MAG TPA: chemotaxis protein CheC [Geobacter sp.]|nr:chemotaxis protein CheC [Geobacter sp.]
MSNPTLQSAELNALTEVCNIGMGHAATALSQLMGKGVEIQVPRLQFVDAAGLAEILQAEEATALHLQILGNVRGSIVVLLRQENALRIVELLLGTPPAAGKPFSDLENSTLLEVGNILASACLNALGASLRMTLLPSVPTMIRGRATEFLSKLMEHGEGESIVMIDTVFSVAEVLCGGNIFLIPATASLDAMLGALGHQ